MRCSGPRPEQRDRILQQRAGEPLRQDLKRCVLAEIDCVDPDLARTHPGDETRGDDPALGGADGSVPYAIWTIRHRPRLATASLFDVSEDLVGRTLRATFDAPVTRLRIRIHGSLFPGASPVQQVYERVGVRRDVRHDVPSRPARKSRGRVETCRTQPVELPLEDPRPSILPLE